MQTLEFRLSIPFASAVVSLVHPMAVVRGVTYLRSGPCRLTGLGVGMRYRQPKREAFAGGGRDRHT